MQRVGADPRVRPVKHIFYLCVSGTTHGSSPTIGTQPFFIINNYFRHSLYSTTLSLTKDKNRDSVKHGYNKYYAVKAVHNSAVTGKKVTVVLNSYISLKHRSGKVTEHTYY